MSRSPRQQGKVRQREREKRTERERRRIAERCADWLFEADAGVRAGDPASARRLLEKILRLRPTHQGANERMADLCFVEKRFADGLTHYERLIEPPDWPPLIFR
ncbi:MAG: tetratricopeptide repeat protein, partial [Vicinamibacterales bacterium]